MFKQAVELIFEHEGGYVNHPDDRGLETNFGISKRAYPEVDIKNLTKAEAREIYRRDYWNTISGDDLPAPLALVTFDAAVNSGVHRASKWLQIAVQAYTDGVIGPLTIKGAVAAYNESPYACVERCCDYRLEFIRSLRTYETFGRGWERRIQETREEALEWIETS